MGSDESVRLPRIDSPHDFNHFPHPGTGTLNVPITSTFKLTPEQNLGGNVFPWTHPLVLSSLLIFSISCPLFIYVETHTKLPIMPLHLITRYPRAGLILSNGVGAVIMNAVLFNIPLYFQAVLLESATQ